MKKYNTVLLDLDGTISNTYSGIVKCLGDACAKYGANLADYDVDKDGYVDNIHIIYFLVI